MDYNFFEKTEWRLISELRDKRASAFLKWAEPAFSETIVFEKPRKDIIADYCVAIQFHLVALPGVLPCWVYIGVAMPYSAQFFNHSAKTFYFLSEFAPFFEKQVRRPLLLSIYQ